MGEDPVPLDDVVATRLLDERAPRVRDPGAEARAMAELKRALAGSLTALLQKLVEVALELCRAQSSGISLLEETDGRRFFRWHAVAGLLGHLRWNTLSREFSPCGTVLDRGETLLMIEPERYFGSLAAVPRVAEVLLVPFAVAGETVGTVWVVSHDPACRFDAEDRRMVTELTRFAAAAYERLQSFKAEDVRELSRMHLVPEPARDARGDDKGS